MSGCGQQTPIGGPSDTIDAASYVPVELGRYWVYFDADDRFLTLEFTHMDSVLDADVYVLTYTLDRDTLHDEPVEPSYEEYYFVHPDKGVLLYGYKDYDEGKSATFSPGVPLAGLEMEIGIPVVTSTAKSGQLTRYVTTLVAHGIVQTYFGDFNDAIDITLGPEDGAQPKRFFARGKGLVKFDWRDARFQLYDYGVRRKDG